MLAWFPIALVAAAAPAELPARWSVAPSGDRCVEIDDSLAGTLAGWNDDAETSSPSDGVWGRSNPKNPRQVVLLFRDRPVCEAMLQAMAEERRPRRLDAKAVAAQFERQVEANTAWRSTWRALSKGERKRLRRAAQSLFAGDADREAVVRELDRLSRRLEKVSADDRAVRVDRLRFGAWNGLFLTVFGEPYRAPPPRP